MLAPGVRAPDFADRLGEDRRAAIRHVVTVDRRHDDVREVEGCDGIRDARRLRRVDRVRAPMANGAVAARARADVAEDHERRRPVVQHSPMLGQRASSQTV